MAAAVGGNNLLLLFPFCFFFSDRFCSILFPLPLVVFVWFFDLWFLLLILMINDGGDLCDCDLVSLICLWFWLFDYE